MTGRDEAERRAVAGREVGPGTAPRKQAVRRFAARHDRGPAGRRADDDVAVDRDARGLRGPWPAARPASRSRAPSPRCSRARPSGWSRPGRAARRGANARSPTRRRQRAASIDGAGSPKNVVCGGMPPAGSQREPVNRRWPPRTSSTASAAPRRPTAATSRPPPTSTDRRVRSRDRALSIEPDAGRSSRQRRGSRWTTTSGTRTSPIHAWTVSSVQRMSPATSSQTISPSATHRYPAASAAAAPIVITQSEPESPPAPPADRTRHAPADLEHEGDDEQPGQDAMGDEQPRAARVAGAQRDQSRRGKQHDEHRQEPVEGRAGHRRSGLSSHGEAQSRATTPRTGSPVDCLPAPPIGTHTSFLLGWFGS